jgi:hypothetical protein
MVAMLKQDVDYTYDDPTHYAWGRLSSVTFNAGTYIYGYNIPGRVTMQKHVISAQATIEADYQWDNRGRMTQMGAQTPGASFAYGTAYYTNALDVMNLNTIAGQLLFPAQYNYMKTYAQIKNTLCNK